MIVPVNQIDPLKEAFYKVFTSRSPFESAGRDAFSVKAVLYPTSVLYLEVEQFQALVCALEETKELEFYISMVEFEPEHRVWDVKENSHWACRSPTFEEYYECAEIYIESALYSVSGSWGILQSHEQHALLVCHDELWASFERYYPDWRKDYIRFVNFWREVESQGVNVEWLKPFLSHLTKRP